VSATYLGHISIKTRILGVVEGVADAGRGGEFLELQEPPGGTQFVARRYTRTVGSRRSDALWCLETNQGLENYKFWS